MNAQVEIQLIGAIRQVVEKADGWRVVAASSRWVQAIPKALEQELPSIGVRSDTRAWLTLEFWIQNHRNGLGVFWWSDPVTDMAERNRVIERLLGTGDHTGFGYVGLGDWRSQAEIPFSGRTVSQSWWPKGGEPSLDGAVSSVAEQLRYWQARVTDMIRSLAGLRGQNSDPDRGVEVAPRPHQSPQAPKPAARAELTRISDGLPTPPIPREFRDFRAQPHYTNIFEVYPDETHIFGTEDWHGDWGAEVLFMAKDAGSSRIFLPPSQGGRGWRWITNHARPTNRNLRPLLDALPGGKLYGSFLGPLLRNDDRESGDLVLDSRIREFVGALFEWTIRSMARSSITVAVLGEDAWRELTTAIGRQYEAGAWKQRRLSGRPLVAEVAGKDVNLVALNHPARIQSAVLVQLPGWKWILAKHGHSPAS